jgi:ABC-2 type transport system permease protein
MSNILVIARHEVRRIFVSPLAWAVLAVSQVIFGYVFIGMLMQYLRNYEMADQFTGVSDYIGGGLYGTATIVLLLVMPLMTMRLFSEERKGNTLTLLFSAPVSLVDIVLGKFLITMSFGAAGIFISSLTREPTIAAIGSFGLLLLVWLLKMPAQYDNGLKDVFEYLSLISHYQDLISGLFTSSDVVYYLLFTALFLWLTVQRLDMERN